MARKKAKKKENEFDLAFISPAQAAKIESDIENRMDMLRKDQSGLFGKPKITDVREFMGIINEKKSILENHIPLKLRGQASNKALARTKELAKKIKDELPSKKDYFMPYPKDGSSSDFERIVKQQVRFQTDPKIQSMVREYKHLLRRIDPSDPTISNIERLRD